MERLISEYEKEQDTNVFKGYLRGLMRQLKLLKEALEKKDYETVGKIINELIEDTQHNIED